MNELMCTLEQLWQTLTDKARELVLRGVITLGGAQYLSHHTMMPERHIARYIAKHGGERQQVLIDRVEGIGIGLQNVRELVGEVKAMAQHALEIAQTFLQGGLTLVQARYACARRLRRRGLRALVQMNEPRVVLARRKAHRLQVERARVEKLVRRVAPPSMDIATLMAEVRTLEASGTDPRYVKSYLLSRTPPHGLPAVQV